jgi:DNA repair protein RecN (Recombination protein N)
MLQELAITDFAIIQAVRLRFAGDLVIFTGETGAGKSIVLDAIGALLGERVGADVVRAGAARAIVEGIFVVPPPHLLATAEEEHDPQARNQGDDGEGEETDPDPQRQLAALIAEYGLEGDEGTLIITREIAATGRSVARVNGRAVPINVLARIGAFLVDVHGQGAHLSLLHPEGHINFLDRYADTLPQRETLARHVRAWQAMQREITTLRRDERELERRAELLRYQVEEIDGAALHVGEIEELERERTVLANAERLSAVAAQTHAALAGADDGESPGALALLSQAHRGLSELARIDTSLTETLSAFDESRYQLEDVATTLRDYRDRAEADPERLATIEDRLDRIARLRRKYGATIADILTYGAEAATELAQIDHRDERIADLQTRIEQQRIALGREAIILSERRQRAAQAMSAAMEATLAHLNMRQARFLIQIEHKPDPDGVPDLNAHHSPSAMEQGTAQERLAITPTGIDRVEFLIAPNPGEPPRPLARIASGGETARLMLALKTILARADATPTLIFDEIDAGISGLTGQIVGEMLWQLARAHQVICVTHLPQMAAFGDQHWHVAKRITDDRTSTVVTDLDRAARTLELAQMLGGIATESAARNAAELLDRAAAWKTSSEPQPPPDLPTPLATNGHTPAKRGSKKKA